MANKQFDPLWEIVDEKIALQNAEPGIQLPCPHCAVPLHLGTGLPTGRRVVCGLCGGGAEVVETSGVLCLKAE